jgi:hypothetical protein
LTLRCRWTRLTWRRTGTTQDATTGDHEISVRGDFEQVEAAARGVIRTSTVAPRNDTKLRVAQAAEIFGAVDNVSRQRRDFFFHCGEAAGTRCVRALVDLGLPREGGGVGLWRSGLLRGRRLLWGRRLLCSGNDPNARRDERDGQGTANELTDVMRSHARNLPHLSGRATSRPLLHRTG